MQINFPVTALMVISGTMITFSSSSWLSAWLGSELNLLGFIPWIKTLNNPSSQETSMKYFLIQTLASTIFLMSLTPSPSFSPFPSQLTMLTLAALHMKMASAPLHFWLPSMALTMSWPILTLLLSWQKLAPLAILTSIPSNFTLLFITLNALIGPILSLNQTSLMKLLVFSSISHSAWIITASILSPSLTFMYFLSYSIALIPTCFFFFLFNLKFLNQIPLLNTKSKLPLTLNLLTLMGFPPFLMFFPKALTILHLVFSPSLIPLMILLTLSSLTSMFSYTRSFSQALDPPSPQPYYLSPTPTYNPLLLFSSFLPFLTLPIIIL